MLADRQFLAVHIFKMSTAGPISRPLDPMPDKMCQNACACLTKLSLFLTSIKMADFHEHSVRTFGHFLIKNFSKKWPFLDQNIVIDYVFCRVNACIRSPSLGIGFHLRAIHWIKGSVKPKSGVKYTWKCHQIFTPNIEIFTSLGVN